MSFTVNTGFNEALDGLIAVDLRETSARYMKRYMGEEGFVVFQERWSGVDVGADTDTNDDTKKSASG